MQKEIASKLSFVFTAFTLALSLIAFASINGSLAWLADNKQVSAGGMSVNVASEDIEVSSVEYYKYNSFTGKGELLDITQSNALALNEYDSVFTDRNENTAIIIKMYLTGDAIEAGNNIKIAFSCTGDLYYTNSNGDQSLNPVISNILNVKLGFIDSLDGVTDANAIFNGAKTHFSDSTNSYLEDSFAILETDSNGDTVETKKNTFEFELSGYTASDEIEVFICLNYSPELVNKYLADQSFGSVSSSFLTNLAELDGDLDRIVLSVAE